MTPARSALRVSALYHARGMITQAQYREFRCSYVRAVMASETPPELPADWHQRQPGSAFEKPETQSDALSSRGLSKRAMLFLLVILAAAAGGAAVLLGLTG